VFFALSILVLQLMIGFVRLWIEGYLPKILLVARAHSISPFMLVERVLLRKLAAFKVRVTHALRLDVLRIPPSTAAAILHFRSTAAARRRSTMPMGVDHDVMIVTTGSLVDLRIDGVLPPTKCFIQVSIGVSCFSSEPFVFHLTA
jgi:hypothetical protein